MSATLDLPPTRRERSKLDRRRTIVDAARTSFLQLGYAGTSMSGLLKVLGGSKATLWSYFRSKEELFAAVIEDVSRSFRAELGDALSLSCDLEPALVKFCRVFIHNISRPDALATWRLVVAESRRFPEVGRIFYERSAGQTYAALSVFFAHHIARGTLRDDDPLRMADVLTSLCTGRQSRLLWGIADIDADAIDDDAARFAGWFMRAYAPVGEPVSKPTM